MRHNLFLAAKESITNVVRHAQATAVVVRVQYAAGRFTLEVQDTRRGLNGMAMKAAALRNGLRNMRKRMEDVGGTFAMEPAPEQGTLVRLVVPIENART